MLLESACSCLCAAYWSQVLSGEWRCSWSSADRRCTNYIWLINNSIAYKGASYFRDLTVVTFHCMGNLCLLSRWNPLEKGMWNETSTVFVQGVLPKLQWFVYTEHSAEVLSGLMPDLSRQLHRLTSDAWESGQWVVTGIFTPCVEIFHSNLCIRHDKTVYNYRLFGATL